MSTHPDAAEGVALPGHVRGFLAAPNFMALATLEPDGAPRQALIWYDLVGNELLINSRVGRRWPRNVQRDARVGIGIFDPGDPYRWVGITGVVSATDDEPERALADIQALARRYHPNDPRRPLQFVGQSRVTFLIRIVAFHDHLD